MCHYIKISLFIFLLQGKKVTLVKILKKYDLHAFPQLKKTPTAETKAST